MVTCVVPLLVAGPAAKQGESADAWRALRQAEQARDAANATVVAARGELAAARSEEERLVGHLTDLHRKLAAASAKDRQRLEKDVDDASTRLDRAKSDVQVREAKLTAAERGLSNADTIVESRLQAVVAAAKAKAASAERKEEEQKRKRAEAEAVRKAVRERAGAEAKATAARTRAAATEVKRAEKDVAAAGRDVEEAVAAVEKLKAGLVKAEADCATAKSRTQAAAEGLAKAGDDRGRKKAARALEKAEEQTREESVVRDRLAKELAEAGKGVAAAQQALTTARKRLGSARKAQADLVLERRRSEADAEAEAQREAAAAAKEQAENAARTAEQEKRERAKRGAATEAGRRQAEAEAARAKREAEEEKRKRSEEKAVRKAARAQAKAEKKAAAERATAARSEARRKEEAKAERAARQKEKEEEKRKEAEAEAARKAARKRAEAEEKAAAARAKAARADVRRAEKAVAAAERDVKAAEASVRTLEADLSEAEAACTTAKSRVQAATKALAEADSERAKARAGRSLTKREETVRTELAERDRLTQALKEARGAQSAAQKALATARTQLASATKAQSDSSAERQAPERRAPDARKTAPVPVVQPPTTGAEAGERDGPKFGVSEFSLCYGQPREDLPSLADAARQEVTLGRVVDGYVAPREGIPAVSAAIADLPGLGPGAFYASAIKTVDEALVRYFNERGLAGVYVAPHEGDIDREGPRDLREGGGGALRLVVYTSVVTDVRTLAAGKRVPAEDRINHPKHARILKKSPIKPAGPEAAKGRDLLRKDRLDDYVLRLNRHPGRRVEAAVASGEQPGEVIVDYLVTENRPWMVYAQALNAGTEHTDKWIERVGFIHHQLTGRDDTFSVDYVTTGFGENSKAVSASYDMPVPPFDRLRLRVYGGWYKYLADELGAALIKAVVEGDGWAAGGELSLNVLQLGEVFVDVSAGCRWQYVSVVNDSLLVPENDSYFLLPYVGLRLERTTDATRTQAGLNLEWNSPDTGHTDIDELEALGRLEVDEDWTALQWDVSHSFYLEPVLNRGKPVWDLTLAHELALTCTGQHVFDDKRVVPQFEEVAGGLSSVRGYRESIVAGDNAVVATAEYRLHLPQVLKLEARSEQRGLLGLPFRFLPDRPNGPTDWELVLRCFFDIGRTTFNERTADDVDATLMSCGAGVGLQLLKNLSLSCDWGYVLKDVEDTAGNSLRGGERGDNRFSFVGTVYW